MQTFGLAYKRTEWRISITTLDEWLDGCYRQAGRLTVSSPKLNFLLLSLATVSIYILPKYDDASGNLAHLLKQDSDPSPQKSKLKKDSVCLVWELLPLLLLAANLAFLRIYIYLSRSFFPELFMILNSSLRRVRTHVGLNQTTCAVHLLCSMTNGAW